VALEKHDVYGTKEAGKPGPMGEGKECDKKRQRIGCSLLWGRGGRTLREKWKKGKEGSPFWIGPKQWFKGGGLTQMKGDEGRKEKGESLTWLKGVEKLQLRSTRMDRGGGLHRRN